MNKEPVGLIMVSSERLIEIVKKYPVLYDAVHPDYGDETIKAKIWDKIGQVFRIDGTTAQEVWTNLKNTYLRHIKDVDKSKIQISRGYSFMHWVKTMEYFKPFFQFAASLEANIPNSSCQYALLGNSDSSDVSTTFSEELLQKPKIRRKRQPRKDVSKSSLVVHHPSCTKPDLTKSSESKQEEFKEEPQTDSSLTTSKDNQSKQRNIYPENRSSNHNISTDGSFKKYYLDSTSCKNISMDAMELIFLGYAKTVKAFTPIRQTYTKMKIAQIIMEQEIQHLDEGPNSSMQIVPNQGDKNQICKWSESYSSQKPSKDKKPRRFDEIVELL